MARRKPYREGDWVQVPLLRPGLGVAVGRIARCHKHVCLGYFFLLDELPADVAALERLHASQAVDRSFFTDWELLDGTWTVLGQAPGWDRSAWPVPQFQRTEPAADL